MNMNQQELIDFNKPIVIESHKKEWVGSPSEGVMRKSLEKEFTESGRATSLVKFLPGATFAPHRHPMGEEILVLEGVFSDENGDYPAGSYIRNPPGSMHKPFSKEGCVLFVKLDYFQPDDLEMVNIQTNFNPQMPGIGNLKVMGLHSYGTESSALVYWPKGEVFQPHTHFGGEEIYVISGEFIDEHGRYPAGTWMRTPHMSKHFPYVEEETLIYVKTGHL